MSKIIPLNVKIPNNETTEEKVEELVEVVSEMNNILTLIQESLEQTTNLCKLKY